MIFFDPLNIADISDKILEFCNDYESRKNQGEENANKIRKYDHNYFAKKFNDILNEYTK
jgi:glycosyltransferase involved in cell wall biosynthesis